MPNSETISLKCSPGSLPVTAVISAASKSMMGPSFSVVEAVSSNRRKLAPALSSPPKQNEPSNSPGTNHLKPTGTSENFRPSLFTTRSISPLLTSVFPTIRRSDHRVWAGAVHADLAIVIHGHKGEGRIDHGIDDGHA